MLKKYCGWPVLVFGVLLIVLGTLGYQKTGSAISLYVGCGMGAGVLLSALGIFRGKNWGANLALFLSLLLTATFAFRYTATGKIFPAMMSVLSGIMLMYLLGSVAKNQSK